MTQLPNCFYRKQIIPHQMKAADRNHVDAGWLKLEDEQRLKLCLSLWVVRVEVRVKLLSSLTICRLNILLWDVSVNA